MTEARARRWRLPAILLVLCGALGGAVYLEAAPPIVPAPRAAPEARAAARGRPADPSFAMAPLTAYAEVVSRPLFSQTRRPPADAANGERQTAFILIGIVVASGDRHALVSHGTPPRVDRVSEGQNLEGWTIKEIRPDRIVITQGDTEMDVKPAAKPTQPAGAAAFTFRGGAPQPPQSATATSPFRPQFRNGFNNR